MTTDQIITAIGLIGLGGLLKSGFDFLIATRKAKQDAKNSFKEIRYKAIILLSYSLVHYDREKSILLLNRPDINSLDRLKNEIRVEFINMTLFASDSVILKMREFIRYQNSIALNNLAISMRKDLYGIRTNLKAIHFDFELNENK